VGDPQHGIAFGDRVHQHPDGDQVIDLVKGPVLDHHLPVDAVKVLRPPFDLKAVQPHLPELLVQGADDGLDLLLALDALLPHLVGHVPVPFRVKVAKGQVLDLGLDREHAQAMGDGCIDVQRLTRGGELPVGRLEGEGAHVMEPVGEFDHDDSDVLAHRKDHLPPGFRLLLFTVDEVQPAQFRDTVHEGADLRAEVFLNDVQRDAGNVLHSVVHQPCRDAGDVHLQLDEDAGDVKGMGEIILPASPDLSLMGLPGKLIRLSDNAKRLFRAVLGQPGEHLLQGQAFKGSVSHTAPSLQRHEQGALLRGNPLRLFHAGKGEFFVQADEAQLMKDHFRGQVPDRIPAQTGYRAVLQQNVGLPQVRNTQAKPVHEGRERGAFRHGKDLLRAGRVLDHRRFQAAQKSVGKDDPFIPRKGERPVRHIDDGMEAPGIRRISGQRLKRGILAVQRAGGLRAACDQQRSAAAGQFGQPGDVKDPRIGLGLRHLPGQLTKDHSRFSFSASRDDFRTRQDGLDLKLNVDPAVEIVSFHAGDKPKGAAELRVQFPLVEGDPLAHSPSPRR